MLKDNFFYNDMTHYNYSNITYDNSNISVQLILCNHELLYIVSLCLL